MNQKIKLLQDAYAKVGDGLTLYNQFVRAKSLDPLSIRAQFEGLMADLTKVCEQEDKEECAASASSGILRVRLYGGCGYKDVTVSPPDGKSKNPYIGEAAYNAVCFALGTSMLHLKPGEREIAVLKLNGRRLCVISPI